MKTIRFKNRKMKLYNIGMPIEESEPNDKPIWIPSPGKFIKNNPNYIKLNKIEYILKMREDYSWLFEASEPLYLKDGELYLEDDTKLTDEDIETEIECIIIYINMYIQYICVDEIFDYVFHGKSSVC